MVRLKHQNNNKIKICVKNSTGWRWGGTAISMSRLFVCNQKSLHVVPFLFVKERRIWPSRKLSKSLTQPSKLPTWTPWRNVTNVESMCSSGGLGRNPIPENNKNKQWYHRKKWQSNFKCNRKFTSVTWKNNVAENNYFVLLLCGLKILIFDVKWLFSLRGCYQILRFGDV